MRVAAFLAASVLLAGCDTSHVSEGIGPFKSPGAKMREAAAAARDPATAIDVSTPRLTHDGKTILFAFKYGIYHRMLAIMPSDPADKRITVVKLPPAMQWIDPAWAPDEKGLAAVSYCEGDKCYEGARGYNVWRIWLREKDNLKRITADSPDVMRREPFFGKDENELYWVLSERFVPGKNIHMDTLPRFLVRAGDELLYPAPATASRPGAMLSNGLWTASMRPAGRSADGGIYLASEIDTINSRDDPLRRPIRNMQGGGMGVILRFENGAVTLASNQHTDAVAVSRTQPGIVLIRDEYVRHEDSGPLEHFILAKDGVETPLFDFGHPAHALTVSNDLSTIVFVGDRHIYDKSSLWVWHKGDAAPIDLNAPERIKEQCDKEIAAETGLAAASSTGDKPLQP